MNQIIGAQLYTLKDHLKTEEDLIASLAKLKEIGFTAAQFSGVTAPITPQRVREIFDSFGISIVCSHIPWERVLGETEKVAQESIIMGCPVVGISFYPENKLQTADELANFIAQIDGVARVMKKYGLKFAIHNHWNEFHRIDGKTVLQHLRENTDPEAVEFIFCCFWALASGADPVEYLHEFKGRISCCHYKDMTMLDGERAFAPVGEGNMNYKAIFKACEEIGVKYALIEQDICQGDPFDCMARSRQNILALGEEL